jgi:hypothetical protein
VTHRLARGAVGPAGGNDVTAVLTSAVDPADPVAPGAELRLELTVTAGPDAVWGCGYLLLDDLAGSATVTSAEDAEWFPEQRWFRVRADAGSTGTARFTLRVADRPAAPTLRPSLAVSRASRARPMRTPALSDGVFRIATRSTVGLRLVVPADSEGVVPLPEDVAGPVDVSAPRSGTATVTADGRAVRYAPRPGFTGYDRFTLTGRSAEGAAVRGTVTVHVGALDDVPGLLAPPEPGGTGGAELRPWQENEVTGELPWPDAARAARNGTEEGAR